MLRISATTRQRSRRPARRTTSAAAAVRPAAIRRPRRPARAAYRAAPGRCAPPPRTRRGERGEQVLLDVGHQLAGLVDRQPGGLGPEPPQVVLDERVPGCGGHRSSSGLRRRIDSTAAAKSVHAERKSSRARWPGTGQRVVAARRPGGGVAPDGGHQVVLAEPAEQRVDRALARHEPGGRELLHEVVAVALVVLEQGQHAVLDRAATQLRDRRLRSHASQGSAQVTCRTR